MARTVELDPQELSVSRSVSVYVALMEGLTTRSLPVHRFERAYLDAFSADQTHWPEEIYRILNDVFLDVDAYNPDPSTRDDLDIDEVELRQRVGRALDLLRPSTQFAT